MFPPDSEKGFNFRRPAAGSAPQSAESLSTIQKVIRYAEKDDLLLYITAAFGIFMPAVMYFFYRYIHNRFKRAKKKNAMARQTSPENERRTVIFYFPGGTNGKQFAYKLADSLQRFDPLVAKISANELEKAHWPKTLQIFVVSDDDTEGAGTQFAEFVDWLDEIRYEHRKRNYLRGVHFCTVHLAYSPTTNEENEPVIGELEKRLRSLSANSLCRQTIASGKMGDGKSEERKHMDKVCAQLETLLCRFYVREYGSEPSGTVWARALWKNILESDAIYEP